MPSQQNRVTAIAHPNIALIKYWGKRDISLNLPDAGSVSITLDTLTTSTSVYLADNQPGEVSLNGHSSPHEASKVRRCVETVLQSHSELDPDQIRSLLERINVHSENNFPTAAGLASSASGFAALVSAVDRLFDLQMTARQRSVMARRGSGSAARSIHGGFVRMHEGQQPDGSDAFAEQLYPVEHWPLDVIIAVTETTPKKTGSTDGMQASKLTSPYHQAWVDSTREDIGKCISAIDACDFSSLARLSEHSCLKMHASMMATVPPLLYWNPTTLACLHRIRQLREDGLDVFFTVDAGPQVKAICLTSSSEQVREALSRVPGVSQVIRTQLGQGAVSTLEAAA